jgi:hypothetical protein
MLLALNRQYYSGFSWLSHVIGAMPTKPVNFSLRMTEAFSAECQEGARELTALVEETYDLVEAAYPQLAVDTLRQWFRWRRPKWEGPPPLSRPL